MSNTCNESVILIYSFAIIKRESDIMESVYIHVPFCTKICSYCDFPKIEAFDDFIGPYLDALKKEITDKYNNELIKTLYIGGGTPSCLSPENMKKLFAIIKIFNLDPINEFTFECNLSDINENFLRYLKDNGVNRLSIGIQSFNKEKLLYMERDSSFEDALNAFHIARNLGFDNISIDLIYAIPEETAKVLKKDLDLFLKLKPDHISTYSLIVENHTKVGIRDLPINEDIDANFYEIILKALTKHGFQHYEISNFALPGKESKHNLTYWNNEEYYGFGLGAHGYIYGVRYENTRSITNYLNGKHRIKEEIQGKKETMENELILGLRKMSGINLAEFYKKYEINMQEVFPIKELTSNGNLIYKNGYISISPDKIYLMNEILLKLI